MAEGQSARKPLGNVRDGQPDEGGSIKIGSRASVGGALPAAVDDGDRVPLLVDEFGRLIVSGGGGGSIQVQGLIPHDDPDVNENPVKVGGHATNTPRAPVSADGDIADTSSDREGRMRARLSGQAADSKANLDVPLDDYGALMVAGAIAHDTAVEATNYPIKIGGVANDEAPAAVSAVLDMVRAYFDMVGRQQINHELSFAGENLVHDFLATQIKPLAVEQNSWLRVTSGAAVASLVLKASAGRCRMVMATNANAADRYLMLFNATALPANGTIPIWVEHVQATGADKDDVKYIKLPEIADYFDTGIVAAMSSTLNSLTVAGADHVITGLVK